MRASKHFYNAASFEAFIALKIPFENRALKNTATIFFYNSC